MGRTATGNKGMDLSDGGEIVGVTTSEEGDKILVLTTLGFGKISYAKDTDIVDDSGATRHYDGYRLTHRGAKGVTTLNMTAKNGQLVAVRAVNGDEDLLVITSTGIVIRTPLSEVKIAGRNTQGVKIISLDERAKVASISILPHEEPSPEGEEDLVEEESSPASDEEPVTPDALDAPIEE